MRDDLVKPISLFWKRILAMLLDGLILGGVGMIFGFLFFDKFAEMGVWARLVGFPVAFLYFGILNSAIGNGQSLGKKIMKIRVADSNGQSISLGKSFLRTAILTIPFFLNGAMIPPSIVMSPVIGTMLGLLIFGFGGSIVYLYVFNRKTRQSLHDLIVGSYVIKQNANGPLVVPSVATIHYGVIATLFIVVILFSTVIGPKLTGKGPFPELMNIYEKLQAMEGVNVAGVNVDKTFGTGGTSTYLTANVVMRKKPRSFEEAANNAARLILANYPNAKNKNFLTISVVYGFDIGIASGWQRQNFSHSPAEWESIIAGATK